MKAKRQIESSLNSVTMLDGSGGQITIFGSAQTGAVSYTVLLPEPSISVSVRVSSTNAFGRCIRTLRAYFGLQPRTA